MKKRTDFANNFDYLNYYSKTFHRKPFEFSLFNKKTLFEIDYIIERLRIEFPDLEISREEVLKYDEWKLLPECFNDDGIRGFPLYTSLRVEYIKLLIEKWQYTPKQLQIFTNFEEESIDSKLKHDMLDYSKLTDTDFEIVRAFLKHKIESYRLELDHTFSETIKSEVKEVLRKYRNSLRNYNKAILANLPEETIEMIFREVMEIICMSEESKSMSISVAQAKGLLGFTPNIISIGPLSYPENSHLDQDLSEYKYTIKRGGYIHCFEDWNPLNKEWIDGFRLEWENGFFGQPEMSWEDFSSEDRIQNYKKKKLDMFLKFSMDRSDFFAVPEFMVGLDDGTQRIEIKIRDPYKVTTKLFRDIISKIYTRYRDRTNPGRAKWGEKSGKKRLIEERNHYMKEQFLSLKIQKPNLAADKRLVQVLAKVNDEFGIALSHDTAKRIIYTEKGNGE